MFNYCQIRHINFGFVPLMLFVGFPLRHRGKFAWKEKNAAAIWPVTGQDFQNTK